MGARSADITPANRDRRRFGVEANFGTGTVRQCSYALVPNAFGRLFETVDIVKKAELASSRTLSSAEVAEMWKEKVDQAEVGDQVSPKYLATSMKLKRKLFGDADAVGKLDWADAHFGQHTPWDSI